jgi:hypothetical protein
MTDIVINTTALPDAFVGQAYQAAIAYQGNATALSAASVSSGTLPAGLAIDAALPFSRITGTPTAAGTATIKVTLTDTAGAVQSGSLTINVHSAAIPDEGYFTEQGDPSRPIATDLAREWPGDSGD